MTIPIFSSGVDIFSGLLVGILFGFLLRKGFVTRFSILVNQLLLRDFTVMKIMMTAIAVGGAMIYSLRYFNTELDLNISSTTLLASLLGGGIFGIGMAVMGYCPGTGVAALADGANDMWFGLAGMITGAAVYAEVVPWIQSTIKPANQIVKITLPEYFNLPVWAFLGFIWVGVLLLMAVERKPILAKTKS